MAELRRRQTGAGDDAAAESDAAAAVEVPTLVANAVDELLLQKSAAAAGGHKLEPLQLSDSATADSSDHVSSRRIRQWGFSCRVLAVVVVVVAMHKTRSTRVALEHDGVAIDFSQRCATAKS